MGVAASREVLLRADDNASDRQLARGRHRAAQEVVGLRRHLAVGQRVVRGVVVGRVDVSEVDEALDVERARALRVEALELLVDNDVAIALELVALDGLLAGDLALLGRAEAPALDPCAVLGVELVKGDALALDRGQEPDGHGDEPKEIAPLQIGRAIGRVLPAWRAVSTRGHGLRRL